jgi:hypothetical protein
VSAGEEESGVEQDGTCIAQVGGGGGGCHRHFRGGFFFLLAKVCCVVVRIQMRMSGARIYTEGLV